MGMLPWLREDPDHRAILACNDWTTRHLAEREHLVVEPVEMGDVSNVVLLRAKPLPDRQAYARHVLGIIDESRRIARRSPAPEYQQVQRWTHTRDVPHRYREGTIAAELEEIVALAARAAYASNLERSGSLSLVRQGEGLAKTLREWMAHFVSRWS